MDSPGTLPLMGGHPKFGNDTQYRAKAGRDTAPDPQKIGAGVSPAQSDYG